MVPAVLVPTVAFALVAVAATSPTSPQILSAFSGLDDALPRTANVLCPGAAGRDGLPVVIRQEIDQRTLAAADLRVDTASGRSITPLCATLRPASEEDEDRTILLIGELGSADDPPASVSIVGSLRTEDGGDLQGTTAQVIPLRDGPTLVFAEVVPPGSSPRDRCPAHAGMVQRVRVTWTGGVRAPGGEELGRRERDRYRVTLARGSAHTTIVPFALTDLNDNDNNNVLCVAGAGRPVAVAMLAGTVVDPNGDLNPTTAQSIATN